MRAEPHDERVISFDGTEIAALEISGGDGTPLLICNAAGATLSVFKEFLGDLLEHRSVIAWNHRGMHGSEEPRSDRLDAEAQAGDALAVLSHFGIEDFGILSWSNGGRIAFEIAAHEPDRTRGLVVVCGGFGYKLSRLLSNFELASLLPFAAGVGKYLHGTIGGPFRALVGRPEVVGFVRQSGLIAATADTASLVELLKGVADTDLRVMLSTYEELAGSSASHLYGSIEAPTLIIAAERDVFTPLWMMEQMAERIPNATLEIYQQASHYLPLEHPARLARDLRQFFAESLDA